MAAAVLLALAAIMAMSGGDIGLVIFVGVAATLSYSVVRALQRDNARHALLQKVQVTIEQHRSSLVRRRAQLVQPDAYGKPQWERWKKEIEYFITHHIAPSLTQKEYSVLGAEKSGARVVLQCKLYEQPVGNKAVQEAAAAKALTSKQAMALSLQTTDIRQQPSSLLLQTEFCFSTIVIYRIWIIFSDQNRKAAFSVSKRRRSTDIPPSRHCST